MEYCTIREAARLLKVSRPTVYKMIGEGKLDRLTALGRPALNLAQVGRLAAQGNGSKGKTNAKTKKVRK